MMMAARKKILDQRGQAIFELVVFMPFMLILLVLVINLGSAINASINQQKVTRNYFYYLNRNDSIMLRNYDLGPNGFGKFGVTAAGHTFIGWREMKESSASESSLAPCFKLITFPGESNREKCVDPVNKKNTKIIKIFTAYGVCAASYVLDQNGQAFPSPENASTGQCTSSR